MTISNTIINFSDLQTEFGGTNPISLSEYYNAGLYVPATPFIGQNNSIPTAGIIQCSNFIGTAKITTVSYDILGGGGGGGYGKEAGTSSDSASVGGNSVLVFGATVITAAGGVGGLNARLSGLNNTNGYFWYGEPGNSSLYGTGGASGVDHASAGNATGYGAGGGGAGGDYGNNAYDNDGGSGGGGGAGTRSTGTLSVTFGSTLNITIGSGGGGGIGPQGWNGGNGSQGVCRITYNGVTRVVTSNSVITIN